MGTYIHNYHYWGNLVLAEFIRVFKLPLIATQFQYATVLISLLLGLNGIVIGQLIGLRRAFNRWLLFFLYFGGDAIFLLTFFLGKGFIFSMSSLEDGSKLLTNYPRGFSIVLFLAGLNLLIIWLKKKDKYSGLLMAVVMGSLIGFKVYTGFFALVGLGALALYYCFYKKYKCITFILMALLLSLIVYLPVSSGAGGLYFIHFWLFENFASQEALGLNNLILAHYIYLSHNNLPRIILDEIFFFLIYFFAIFSTKIIGVLQNKRSLLVLGKEINIFLLGGILVSSIVGFFFQQYTGGTSTFNFIVSVFIIGSIYTALSLSYWTEKIRNKYIKYLVIILVAALTIPRVIYEINQNASQLIRGEGYLIPKEDLQGFEKLKQLSGKEAVILVDDKGFLIERDSTYIGFLIDRKMFLSGLGILNSHVVDSKERQLAKKIIFNSPDPIKIGKVIQKNKVDFILTDPLNYLGSTYSAQYVREIYQNKKVKILKFSGKDFQKFMKKNKNKSIYEVQ